MAVDPIPFRSSPRPTLGVEWEVALVDPVTRDLAPKAEEVIDIVQRDNPEVHLEKEFLQNTVELVTGVHDTVPQAVAELAHDLNVVRDAAEQLGLKV